MSPAAPDAPAVPPRETMRQHVLNLDLLRAAAIFLVLLVNIAGEHIVDMGVAGNHILESGWIGVDLFFVISGWLIGGLYWRERDTFGNVELGRFWARRWLRTIPPYIAAFAIVSAVRALVLGGGAPAWHYLAFVQNYTFPMPYWSVSWSLCVEEHFYLALPLVLMAAMRVRGSLFYVLGGLVLVSLASRVLTVPLGASEWGLHYTATHMRLEGLVFGVAASAAYHLRPDLWPRIRQVARWLVVPGLAVVASIPWLPLDVINRYAFTAVDLAFTAVLIAVVEARTLPLAGSRAVRWLALVSYSIYMTHTSVLRVYRMTVENALPSVPEALHSVLAFAAVGLVGTAFYVLAERPSLWLRTRLAPRRRAAPAPPAPPAGDGFGDGLGDGHLVSVAMPVPARRTADV